MRRHTRCIAIFAALAVFEGLLPEGSRWQAVTARWADQALMKRAHTGAWSVLLSDGGTPRTGNIVWICEDSPRTARGITNDGRILLLISSSQAKARERTEEACGTHCRFT